MHVSQLVSLKAPVYVREIGSGEGVEAADVVTASPTVVRESGT